MKVEPPGLPTRLVDEHEELFDRQAQSTWDVLALTALDSLYYVGMDNRARVRWLRYSVLHWCCWRPMRIGAVDTQPKTHTFGWTSESGHFVACGRCGRMVYTL